MAENTSKKYTPQELEEIELSRKGSEITLHKIKDYSELLNKDKTTVTKDDQGNIKEIKTETIEKESDRIFIQKIQELWNELVTHGMLIPDKKTGKQILGNFSDLDGECALGLLKLAGIKFKAEYVPRGQSREGKMNIDTGNKQGVVIEYKDENEDELDKDKNIQKKAGEENKNGKTIYDNYGKIMTVYIDHHDPVESLGKNTCATKETYKLLVSMGLLKKEDQHLAKLVEFVNNEDNKLYYEKELRKNFLNSPKTVLGLHPFIPFHKLEEFFRAGGNPLKPLTVKDLIKYGLRGIRIGKGKKSMTLIEKSEQIAERVKISIDELKKMEQEGFIINSNKYGKIAVDIGKRIPLMNDAARAFGCKGYVLWNPANKSFFITTVNIFEDELSQGEKRRDRMWSKPKDDEAELKITLGEILNKMTDGKLEPEGELKKYLDEEMKGKSKKDKDDTTPSVAPKITTQPVSATEPQEPNVELMEKVERKPVEFTKKETMDIEGYVIFAEGYLEDVDNFYTEENDFEKEDIAPMVKRAKKRFWEHEIFEEMSNDGRIREEIIPEAVKEVKKRMKERSRIMAEADNATIEIVPQELEDLTKSTQN